MDRRDVEARVASGAMEPEDGARELLGLFGLRPGRGDEERLAGYLRDRLDHHGSTTTARPPRLDHHGSTTTARRAAGTALQD